MRKWALAADQDGVEDTVCEKYNISKEKWAQFCQTRIDPSWEDVRKKAQAIQKQNTAPHDSFEEQATQGSFVPHGRQDVLTAAIGRLEHPGCVRAARAGVSIKQYFGSAPRMSRSSSSLPPEELQQLTQQIRDQLVKSITEKVVVSPAKPPPKPDPEVDDPLYLMTVTTLELFLRPYQVTWDVTVFGVFNPNFPLYINHKDLSEIAQSIQRSGQSQFESESYIKSWMQSSKCNVSLAAYLNGGHWQMVAILPKEHLVVWFCSLHNRPDNYLKGIINSALKGLDDARQPKSKAPARWIVVKCNRQKGSTECGYYVMHWMSTIILGAFRNNWEAYFNDPRTLELERLKALHRPSPDECCESCVFGVFHIDKNVKAKCKSLIGQKNASDYVMDNWGNLADCPSEQEFLEHLQRLQVVCSLWPMFVDYVCETWIVPHKEKFITAWTNKVMHLCNTTTNRVESAHWSLKRVLQNSVGDLCSV
ncbi:hypothetical protein GmHk_14G041901 [Glycine max]|nr:hypothetical protein GmHk_14G041901 [Glycine max]